ncbi:kinase/pyrophosphorylase, partial [Microbacterium sp. GbtcB4]|uniref:kinase/pyrophosphorylase n=1 Tax=Microbacterium sp. GbtcB4 TaxID=2824749 RepID=UPI0034D4093E
MGLAFASVPAVLIDLPRGHLTSIEATPGASASPESGRYHSLADTDRYFTRNKAIEYTIEHDDGQSFRRLDRADVI